MVSLLNFHRVKKRWKLWVIYQRARVERMKEIILQKFP
jgi:hypothetical protein